MTGFFQSLKSVLLTAKVIFRMIELPVKRDSLHTVQTGKEPLQKIDAVAAGHSG